jgi:hypothetical protein
MQEKIFVRRNRIDHRLVGGPVSNSCRQAVAFAHSRSNRCGSAVANFGFASALLQPNSVIRHGEYMQVGGSITQFKVTADPRSGGISTYKFRTHLGASR